MDFPASTIIPDKGIIKKHIDLVRPDLLTPPQGDPLTEAPLQFVYAGIISALSTIIGKSAWIPWFGTPLYCNTFILLIGESTITRKTTCVKMCEHYLADMVVADPSITDLKFASTGSPEGIFEELAGQPQGIFIYSEFSTLTNLLEKKYAADLKSFLTDLFDGGTPQSRKLSGKKRITVSNYYINLIAGTATDWFEQANKRSDFKSGWYTRFLFIWGADTGMCICFPPKSNNGLRASIVGDLITLHKTVNPGEMQFTNEAKAYYETWYRKRRNAMKSDTKTMDVRLYDYCLKLSMINALSETRVTITAEDMERSLAFMEWLMANNRTLMNEYISFNVWDVEVKRISKILKEEGEMSRRDLMRKLHLNSKQFDMCIQTLVDYEWVKIITTSAGDKGGRPSVSYKHK